MRCRATRTRQAHLPTATPAWGRAYFELRGLANDMWLRNDTSNGPFGPLHSPRFIYGLRADLAKVVSGLLDAFEGKDQVDIVGAFYTLPVGPRLNYWPPQFASLESQAGLSCTLSRCCGPRGP